jgi:hypothetical protein
MSGYVYRDPKRARHALIKSVGLERYTPEPRRVPLTRDEQQLADLRELIHVLAMALTEGKAAS